MTPPLLAGRPGGQWHRATGESTLAPVRLRLSLPLLVALGCQAPTSPGPAAPTEALAPAVEAPLSSASFAPVPPPPPAPRLLAPEPFAVVARTGSLRSMSPFELGAKRLLIASIPGEPGPIRFALLEGENARRRRDLERGFPLVEPGFALLQALGEPGGPLWVVIQKAEGEVIVNEVLRHDGKEWGSMGVFASQGGAPAALWNGGLLVVKVHADASRVPEFAAFGVPAGTRLPTFSQKKNNPRCRSWITTVFNLYTMPTGEILALGTSCWIPFLQIERWAPGKVGSEVSEQQELTINNPQQSLLALSADELQLEQVTLNERRQDPVIYNARLKHQNGRWKIVQKTEPPAPAVDELTRAIEGKNLQVIDTKRAHGQDYHSLGTPSVGPTIEQILVRRAPVKEEADLGEP